MDVVAERRFQSKYYTALKKRLDSLRYCEPLGLDSAPLVEKLLTDLLKTTEGFQQLKKQNFEANSKIKSLNETLLPLQNEVASLMKKNNELHLHLMSTKEDFDSKDSFWRASVRKLEVENSDLNFLIKKTKDDLSRMESQNLDLRTRLDTFMAKTYTTQKPINEGKDMNVGRVQTFDLSRPLNSSVFGGFSKPDNVWANELRASDERTKRVLEELEDCRKGKITLDDEVRRIKSLLDSRNLEISRLSAMIGTEFKPELLTNKYRESLTSANIEQLNDRIDLLNKENIKLENELSKAKSGLDRFLELEKENKFMVENLSELRNQNQSLQIRLSELDKIGKGLISTGETEKLKSMNIELQNKIRGIEKELQKATEECNRNEMYKNAYNADKQSYTEAIEKIDNERSQLNEQVIELEGLLQQAKNDLSGTKDKEKMYQAQINNLKREIDTIQQTYSKINKDHLSTTEETYQLRSRISALESQINVANSELEAANFEVQRQAKLKKSAEDALEETRKELLRSKTELDSLNAQKQKLHVLYDSSMKEGNNLKDESSHLIKLREKDKQALIEAEDRLREMNNQLSAAMHSNRIIQKEHQNISDELAGKLEELRRVNMAKSSYEQELAELRPLKLKYQQLAEESTNLKNSALNKESAQTRLQRQIDSLEDALRAKDISLSEQNKSLEKYKEEILRLEGELDNIQDHAALLNSNVKQTEYLQSEASSLKQQINEYRDKERDQIRTIEQLKSELKKAAEAVKGMQKQLQRTSELKQNLENEVERYKGLLGDMQNKDLNGQNNFVKLEEKIFQAELLAEELKRQVANEQHNRYRAEDEATHLKTLVENEKSTSQRLLEQNTQLKSLISNLEKMKEELLKKLSGFTSEKNLDDEHRNQLVSEISQLRKELASKNSESIKINEAIKSIDQERDYIQSLLDQKTEDYAALENQIAAMQKDGFMLKDNVNTLQQKEASYNKRIEEKDFQIKKLGEKCKHLESELEEVRSVCTQQSRNIQELNEHLVAITKENQYVNDQLMKTSYEKDNLKKYYEDKSRNERSSQQLARAMEREKEDILITYKKACEENERMTQALAAMTGEQRETYVKLQACEQELVNAQSHIAQQEHEIFNLNQELSTLERQVSHLTFQLETADRKVQEVMEMKESFMREVNSARQVALNVESSKDDLIRKLSSAENEKLILESKIRSLQSELSAVKSQVEFERQKSEELQIVLAKERETLFKTQKDLGKLEMNKGFEEDMISNQLQSTRNQVMNLEMENIKLKEENGKLEHKKVKFETKVKELEGQLGKTSAAFRYADDWD